MTRKMKVVAAAVAAVATALTLSSCGKVMEPFNDAAVSGQNKGPAEIINFPDGFSNVAAKCDGTTRVYVIFHADSAYGSVAAVPNSPECSG